VTQTANKLLNFYNNTVFYFWMNVIYLLNYEGMSKSWGTFKKSTFIVNIKVKLSLCLTKHHAMKMYWGSGSIAPRILDLDTRWRWVVSLTPRPLYSQGKNPWYPLDRKLGGHQSQSGRGGEDKNSQPHRESNPITPIVQPVAQLIVNIQERN
jgi:hypothetical protein